MEQALRNYNNLVFNGVPVILDNRMYKDYYYERTKFEKWLYTWLDGGKFYLYWIWWVCKTITRKCDKKFNRIRYIHMDNMVVMGEGASKKFVMHPQLWSQIQATMAQDLKGV